MVARFNKNKKSSAKTTLKYSVFIIVAVFIVIFLGITNWRIYQKREYLSQKAEELKVQVQELEKTKSQLEEKKFDTESEDYLEQVARNQLNMKKQGEQVYVVQKEFVSEQDEKETEEKKSWWDKIKSLWARD